MNCAAKGCANDTSEGAFIGDLCAPCHEALVTGKAEHGTSILFTQQAIDEEFRRDYARAYRAHKASKALLADTSDALVEHAEDCNVRSNSRTGSLQCDCGFVPDAAVDAIAERKS